MATTSRSDTAGVPPVPSLDELRQKFRRVKFFRAPQAPFSRRLPHPLAGSTLGSFDPPQTGRFVSRDLVRLPPNSPDVIRLQEGSLSAPASSVFIPVRHRRWRQSSGGAVGLLSDLSGRPRAAAAYHGA